MLLSDAEASSPVRTAGGLGKRPVGGGARLDRPAAVTGLAAAPVDGTAGCVRGGDGSTLLD